MKRVILFLWILVINSAPAEDIKFDSITTTDGKTYKNVIISEVTPSGIRFIHLTGVGSVNFENLPKEIQHKFHFDPLDAYEYEQKKAKEEAEKRLRRLEARRLASMIKEERLKEERLIAERLANEKAHQPQIRYTNKIRHSRVGNRAYQEAHREEIIKEQEEGWMQGDNLVIDLNVTPEAGASYVLPVAPHNKSYRYSGNRVFLDSDPSGGYAIRGSNAYDAKTGAHTYVLSGNLLVPVNKRYPRIQINGSNR